MATLWGVNALACGGRTPPPSLQTERWPTYLGVLSRSPSLAESLAAEPRLRWRARVGRAVPGGVAVTEDFIAAGTSDRYLVLLDRKTGETVWRRRLPGSISSVPLVVDATVYAATDLPKGRVRALTLSDGDQRWEIRSGPVSTHLALAGGLLMVPQPGAILALDTATGEERWRTALPGPLRAAPTPIVERLLVSTITDSAFLVSMNDGRVVQRLGLAGSIAGAPAVALLDGPAAGGRVHLVAGTTAGRVLCWISEGDTLRTEWSVSVGAPVMGSVALDGDTALALTREGALWRIPLQAPDAASSVVLDTPALAGPTPFAQGILVATLGGEILWLDRRSGRSRTVARVDGPVTEPPLVRHGDLVLVSGQGHIQVYR